ncbi:lanthionine synthetase C family protein [Streptomyces sp. NPDC127069]|uniref:lanthionine synthetase C family protein n=1 Tax=Streptomyces sp. NPDC127069 TaxID=3347128 RepID=UPI00365C07EF
MLQNVDRRMPGAATAPPRPWRPGVQGTQRATAMAVAYDVARRCTDRHCLSQALAQSARHTKFPQATRWLPYGVATGDAGIAVLCAYCDACRPDEGWDAAGHAFLITGLNAAAKAAGGAAGRLPSSLFSGLPGLMFAVSSLSRGDTRYGRALAYLDDELAPLAQHAATRLAPVRHGRPVSDFDLISGASGLVPALMVRDPHRLLPALLTALVGLAAPTGTLPTWATPPDLLGNPSMRAAYPYGNLNCGMAHGISGPMAVLALALKAGHEVPGQREAIRSLADWLTTHRADDAWGTNWPPAIPLAPPNGRPAPPPVPSRSSWCYGSPGIARALWHAGEALDDAGLRRSAVDAVTAVLARPTTSPSPGSATFCHGTAGLLQVVLRFAHDTGLPPFTTGTDRLVDRMLASFDTLRPVGYAASGQGGEPVDRPDLLDGAAGVALALLSATTDAEPDWDRLFLLS